MVVRKLTSLVLTSTVIAIIIITWTILTNTHKLTNCSFSTAIAGDQGSTRNSQTRLRPTGRPKILFWARLPPRADWTLPDLENGDGQCDMTVNRNEIGKTDAVVFLMKTTKINDLPPPESRRPNQAYVWFVRESPWTVHNMYKRHLSEYNDYYNWTMTYRMDSDIIAAMWPTPAMDFLFHMVGRKEDMLDSELSRKPTLKLDDYRRQLKVILSLKNQLVAWIASNCGDTVGAKHRKTIVKDMESKGLNISKFGGCSGRPLPYNNTYTYETISHFKFYLAFENSYHCKDYLTEKVLYNAFISGTVPIIHGPLKEDVAKILPAKSYIYAEDFKSLKDLKEYLVYLDNNDDAYSEYFEWWMEPGAQLFPRYGFNYGAHYVPRVKQLPQFSIRDVQETWLDSMRFGSYHLCRKLKRGDHLNNYNVVKDLDEYWFGGITKECVAR